MGIVEALKNFVKPKIEYGCNRGDDSASAEQEADIPPYEFPPTTKDGVVAWNTWLQIHNFPKLQPKG